MRFPDSTANPYLAFSAMLMAGIDGIQNKIHPGDAMDKDLYDLPAEEEAKIPQVCFAFDQALEALDKDRARLEAILPGTYFWRIATVGSEDLRSEWSTVRRFRIFSSDQRSLLQDDSPPPLEVNPPHQLGNLFILEGRTEVGAVVTVNGEVVRLDSQGHFRKTVELVEEGWKDLVIQAEDPSGNRTERRERVHVEVY